MDTNILALKSASEKDLEEKLKDFLAKHDIEPLERIFARAISNSYDQEFQDSFNANKLSEDSLDKFKENADGRIAYDHARLFEQNDGSKILICQPYDISENMLNNYMEFARKNEFRLEISNRYSAWYPSKALSVIFWDKNLTA